MLSLRSFLDAAPYQPTRDISEGRQRKKKCFRFSPNSQLPNRTARRLHDRSMTPLLSFKGEALLRVQKYVFYMMSRMNFVVTTCTDTQSEELWEMSGLQQLEFGLEERGITMKIRRLCCFHCSICSKVYGVCRYMYVAIPSFFYFHWRNLPYVHESESIDEYDKAI